MTSNRQEVRLQSVTSKTPMALAAFLRVEATAEEGWAAEVVRSYPGVLLLGLDEDVPAGEPPLWVGSAAYRTLGDVGWVLVDLVRGESPAFYDALGRRLISVRKVKRVGLLLRDGHPGIDPLEALDFSAVRPADVPDNIPHQPHLLPTDGWVRMVWNAGFAHKGGR